MNHELGIMDINIKYEVSGACRYQGVLKEIIRRAVLSTKCPRGRKLSIIFVGDAKMRRLNRVYRGKDMTTNVLSFANHDSKFLIPDSDNLGDIFISMPFAKREAKKFNWTLKYEISRLVAHGFLHLVGYDHENEKEARKMGKIESKILKP